MVVSPISKKKRKYRKFCEAGFLYNYCNRMSSVNTLNLIIVCGSSHPGTSNPAVITNLEAVCFTAAKGAEASQADKI